MAGIVYGNLDTLGGPGFSPPVDIVFNAIALVGTAGPCLVTVWVSAWIEGDVVVVRNVRRRRFCREELKGVHVGPWRTLSSVGLVELEAGVYPVLALGLSPVGRAKNAEVEDQLDLLREWIAGEDTEARRRSGRGPS